MLRALDGVHRGLGVGDHAHGPAQGVGHRECVREREAAPARPTRRRGGRRAHRTATCATMGMHMCMRMGMHMCCRRRSRAAEAHLWGASSRPAPGRGVPGGRAGKQWHSPRPAPCPLARPPTHPPAYGGGPFQPAAAQRSVLVDVGGRGARALQHAAEDRGERGEARDDDTERLNPQAEPAVGLVGLGLGLGLG